MDAANSSCSAQNVTFVTLVSGRRYILPALCLPRQMRRVGSTCPLLAVLDDRPSHKLQQSEIRSLEHAYGEHTYGSMIQLSMLQERVQVESNAADGRRLFEPREKHITWLKLWLWALPVAHAVFIDLDLMFLGNVDSLLLHPLTSFKEVAGVTCRHDSFFNTGLFAFTPSIWILQVLLRIAAYVRPPWNGNLPFRYAHGLDLGPMHLWVEQCAPAHDSELFRRLYPNYTRWWRTDGSFCQSKSEPGCSSTGDGSDPRLMACRRRHKGGTMMRMAHACEMGYTDQSIINHAFPRHVSLPERLNFDATHPQLYGHTVSNITVVHFIAEPKPWVTAVAGSRHSQGGVNAVLSVRAKRWRVEIRNTCGWRQGPRPGGRSDTGKLKLR